MSRSNFARVVPPAAGGPTPRADAARRADAVPAVAPRREPRRARSLIPVAVTVLVLAGANAVGVPYYLATRAERVRHPLHPWLRPSGYVGQIAGILAIVVFLFLWLYPLRKRWKALVFTGPIGRWLDVHVTAAIGLPLLLTLHAAWRSEGLIGLGFDAMLVVVASGVVGRYLYTRIPRARSGIELTRDEVASQREALVGEIARTTGLSSGAIEASLQLSAEREGSPSLWSALESLVLSDVRRWRLARELPKRWAALAPPDRPLDRAAVRNAVRLARREIALTQQSRMLDATHRLFRFWHVAHKPFAITALIAVLVHVVVVTAVGATWFY